MTLYFKKLETNAFTLEPRTWSKINPSIKNIKPAASFMQTLKKSILLSLQTQIDLNNYIIIMMHIIFNMHIIMSLQLYFSYHRK